MESAKHRWIRVIFVLFFSLITIFAINLRYEKLKGSVDFPIQLIVLKQSQNDKENPTVAMYQFVNKQHVLTIYSVLLDDRFKFKALHSIVLKDKPIQLINDIGNGLWIQTKHDWLNYDEQLRLTNKNTDSKLNSPKYTLNFQYHKKDQSLTVFTHKNTFNFKEAKSPNQVYQLSHSDDLLLALFEDTVKILVSEYSGE